jgi:excisionase family DNA binding protein
MTISPEQLDFSHCGKGNRRRQLQDEIMKVADVAVYLKIHRNTVYRLAKGGDLPVFLVGSSLRFRRSEIDQVVLNVTDLGQQKAP